MNDPVTSYIDQFGQEPSVVVRAPGRVNLLGAHVDYNEGWVLPGAIDRAIWVAAGPGKHSEIWLKSLDFGEDLRLDLDRIPSPSQMAKNESRLPLWAKYPVGTAYILQTEGIPLRSLNAIVTGDIPIGAGVSSSAAVEIAFIMAWESVSGYRLSERRRALLGQRVENEYLGVNSGIMDQYACVHGQPDHLILLDCRSIDHELVPLPVGTGVIVADSGIRRELANSEYNLRREQCQEALAIIKEDLPQVHALRDVSVDAFQGLSPKLPRLLRMRAQHVVEECERVLAGAQALRQGNLNLFGEAIIGSHVSSRDLYEVSIKELDVLAEAAWEAPGCYGARLTGAGFGGCVVAFVNIEAQEDVTCALIEAYASKIGREPMIFSSRIADGAAYLEHYVA